MGRIVGNDVFHFHLAAAGRVEQTIRRLLGIDLKMRQYADGARFVRAVVDQIGMDGFNKVWESPATIPTMSEISNPPAWITRVAGGYAAAPPAVTGPASAAPATAPVNGTSATSGAAPVSEAPATGEAAQDIPPADVWPTDAPPASKVPSASEVPSVTDAPEAEASADAGPAGESSHPGYGPGDEDAAQPGTPVQAGQTAPDGEEDRRRHDGQ
ncbi:MAG: zinc-dependent metalloprotease [Streptosporangiaceae bacterium]